MDSTDYWETLDGSASQAQAYMNTAFSSSSENTVDTYLGDNNYTTVPYLADRNAISPTTMTSWTASPVSTPACCATPRA